MFSLSSPQEERAGERRSLVLNAPLPVPTAIELSELRQDRSADFSPLPAVLAGPESGGLKSALLNSMAVGTGRGAFNKSGLLSPALSSCGEERENMSSGQAVVVSKCALRVGAQLDTTTRN